MKNYPCAKINLGLNVVSKRDDGYHNLETVFFPIPINDTLEVKPLDVAPLSGKEYELSMSGKSFGGYDEDNIVVKAFMLLKKDFDLPDIHIELDKFIPTGAGLGGGSSDCASMIKILNDMFIHTMTQEEMEKYAAKLGADCAFFINGTPAYATGIGDILTPVNIDIKGYYLTVVKPDTTVSTREAYGHIIPKRPAKSVRDIINQPIETWKDELKNDFEDAIFPTHPEIAEIKQHLYDSGAVYASMSGSGSAVFGLFKNENESLSTDYKDIFCCTKLLQ